MSISRKKYMTFGGRVKFVTTAAGYCQHDNVNKLRPAAHYLKCEESSTLRPASWSSSQSFWLLITRSRVRFPVLPWEFSLWGRTPVVTMVCVVSRFRLKVETSATMSQKSINSDWTHKRSPRWRGPHHVRESTKLDSQTASTSARRLPCTVIAD